MNHVGELCEVPSGCGLLFGDEEGAHFQNQGAWACRVLERLREYDGKRKPQILSANYAIESYETEFFSHILYVSNIFNGL